MSNRECRITKSCSCFVWQYLCLLQKSISRSSRSNSLHTFDIHYSLFDIRYSKKLPIQCLISYHFAWFPCFCVGIRQSPLADMHSHAGAWERENSSRTRSEALALSSLFNYLRRLWTPVFTGVTTFYEFINFRHFNIL